MKFGEGVATHVYYKLHQVSSKPDEKQKSFINRPFFCSEFQSVTRIVKIVHCAYGPTIFASPEVNAPGYFVIKVLKVIR